MEKGNEEASSRLRKRGSAVPGAGFDATLTKRLDDIIEIHNDISIIEQKRYGKIWDQDLTNVVQTLSGVTGFLTTYLDKRRKNEKYGTEEK